MSQHFHATTTPTQQTFTFLYAMLRPFWGGMGVMLAVAVLWAINLSLKPYMIKMILDRATSTPQTEMAAVLMAPAAFYMLFSFLESSSYRAYDWFVHLGMIPKLRKRIVASTFSGVLGQSHTFFQTEFAGSLGARVDNLVRDVPEMVQIVIDYIITRLLAIIIAIYVLWQVNIAFALAITAWIACFLLVSVLLTKKLVVLSDRWSHASTTVTGRFVDVMTNMLSVRLFARGHNEEKYLDKALDVSVDAESHLERTYFWMWMWYGYSFVSIVGLNLYFLIQGLAQGWISIGDFALVLTITLGLGDELWVVSQELSKLSKSFGRTTQAVRTMFQAPEMTDLDDAVALKVARGDIIFHDVDFHYKGTKSLFSKLSITIQGGQKVGLVGYSGSGKTTFVNLILRLFDVSGGTITIDGHAIHGVTRTSLAGCIGMIPQDPPLFNRTLMDNIRYGRMDATDHEVMEAARRAHAHDFIQALPLGYDALVGERGIKLSGGQRQRISIARALLKNAPILILDEATSQLDSVTEHAIQESLEDLMQDKTTLVVAHRLSTIMHMDRILVFDKGRIVEDGTPDALLAQNGLYKTLWDAQVGGFLPDAPDGKVL